MDQADFFISYNKADVHWAMGIGDWLDQVGFSTILQAQDFVDLSFEKGGRVSAVHVTVGDRVKAGASLLELDHADLAAQRAEAEAAYLVQKAKLAEEWIVFLFKSPSTFDCFSRQ